MACQKGMVKSTREIRQGDQISPYLFLFVAKGLISLLKNVEAAGRLSGHRICENTPIISHLLFADDSILFCKATIDQARVVKELLAGYENASGQKINLSKSSVFFSKGVPQHARDEITLELDIIEVLAQDKYMGLPTYVGRSKKKALLPIQDRIGKRLSSWMDKLVSWAGREVLIKTVAQAIPTYAMSVFKFPKDMCQSSQALINRFWRGHNSNLSGTKLCNRKEDGGLGFGDLEAFTDALLAKQL